MSEPGAQVLELLPPPPARSRNISARERCRYCLDTGYVTVQTRSEPWKRQILVDGRKVWKETVAEIEDVGPCPMCERGFAEEFPDLSRCTKAAPIRPPWGEEGFWKGRPPIELQPLESSNPEPV